jgi:hypothetical protein
MVSLGVGKNVEIIIMEAVKRKAESEPIWKNHEATRENQEE